MRTQLLFPSIRWKVPKVAFSSLLLCFISVLQGDGHKTDRPSTHLDLPENRQSRTILVSDLDGLSYCISSSFFYGTLFYLLNKFAYPEPLLRFSCSQVIFNIAVMDRTAILFGESKTKDQISIIQVPINSFGDFKPLTGLF